MKVLLDECVPRKLAHDLAGHEVSTVQREGWSSLRNGKLLETASENWDVLLTSDKSIPWQQVVARFEIGILVVRAMKNDLRSIKPFVREILIKLPAVKPGTVEFIGDPKLLPPPQLKL